MTRLEIQKVSAGRTAGVTTTIIAATRPPASPSIGHSKVDVALPSADGAVVSRFNSATALRCA